MTTSSTAYVVELVKHALIHVIKIFFDLVTYNDKKATSIKKHQYDFSHFHLIIRYNGSYRNPCILP